MNTLTWIVVVVAVVGILSARYGADSRDGADWREAAGIGRPDLHPTHRYTVRGDLTALRSVVLPGVGRRPRPGSNGRHRQTDQGRGCGAPF